jgi:hypothetical protein
MPSSILISVKEVQACLVCPFTPLVPSVPSDRRLRLPRPPSYPYQNNETSVSTRPRKRRKKSHQDQATLSRADVESHAHHESLKPWLGHAVEQVRKAWIERGEREWWNHSADVQQAITFEDGENSTTDDAAWAEWESELGRLLPFSGRLDTNTEPECLKGTIASSNRVLSLTRSS